MISDGYMNYMWDTMKRFSSNLIADMLDEAPSLSELSEQTLFTIAHDIARFREYKEGQIIVHQDRDSVYNLLFQQHERAAINQLNQQDPKQKDLMKRFQSDTNPGVGQIWNHIETKKEFDKLKYQWNVKSNPYTQETETKEQRDSNMSSRLVSEKFE